MRDLINQGEVLELDKLYIILLVFSVLYMSTFIYYITKEIRIIVQLIRGYPVKTKVKVEKPTRRDIEREEKKKEIIKALLE